MEEKTSTRRSWSSKPPPAGGEKAAAPDFLTVNENGAGGAVPGCDPLNMLIPRPEQSDPSEPATGEEEKHQSPATSSARIHPAGRRVRYSLRPKI